MAFTSRIKQDLNRVLRPLNLRIDSLTAEQQEGGRLDGLIRAGHFDRPIAPVLQQIMDCDPEPILQAVADYQEVVGRFADPSVAAGFSFQNSYYQSPDAEVLYAMVRHYKPRRILEIGSGNSSMLFRAAIQDGGLGTRLISIDPCPRCEISGFSDEVILRKVEFLDDMSQFDELSADDILFIDSSHQIRPGNDVLFLLLKVLPALAPGVIVHVHDVFLPYEYPKAWIAERRWDWTEQYLLQALLQGSKDFEVLWAGHFHQRTLPGFAKRFKYWDGADAQSFWIRKR